MTHPLATAARPLLLCSLLAAATASAWAQSAPSAANAATASDPVVVPQVERRPVQPPRFPSKDIEFGLFTGIYATQNFGTSSVSGVRLGYHITEDFFVEGAYAQTKVSDAAFRRISAGGMFPSPSERLTYYNLAAGYHLLPGEVFFGRGTAKLSSLYVLAGIGNTEFVNTQQQTFHYGFGTRLLFNDRVAARLDVRDHVFTLDLLGARESTHNLEVSIGLSVYF